MKFGKYDVNDRVILKNDLAYAFVAYMPILPGHSLLCPVREVATFEELKPEEIKAIFELLPKIKHALQKEFGATGFNVAWNEGEIAGQTVPHLHLHIVPRSEGDKGIAEYEPRQFLYRPGERDISPNEELVEVAQALASHL
ncbi:MAG: HIT domain-containing protein [Simkaniaceae bacterium]|nr:HIT domain-containing protein [Simkaniaceae bacterium]